jgi:hypothetical protein
LVKIKKLYFSVLCGRFYEEVSRNFFVSEGKWAQWRLPLPKVKNSVNAAHFQKMTKPSPVKQGK